jgi:hypothetical protein
MSAKGSSTFGAGLAFGSPFALSEGGRAGAKNFGAPSHAGADGEAFGAGRTGPDAAPVGGALVTVGAVGGAVFAAGTACSGFAAATPCSAFVDMMTCSAFAVATACSAFSGRGGGVGATGGAAGGFTGPLESALSLRGTAALPLLAGALAGMIGGGIPGRG